MHIIITGKVQQGKSTLAAGLVAFLKSSGVSMAGILAPGLWKDGQRHGFNLTDLKTGMTIPLARRVNCMEDTVIFPFEFFDKGMAAGKKALDAGTCANASMIMVDEVGKLELMGRGWAPWLTSLVAIPRAVHVWIVRENLVEAVCRRWHLEPVKIVHVSDTDALERLKRLCVKEEK